LVGSYRSPTGLTYWHRPHTSTNKLPILFIHGVGVGLYPNAKFLVEINKQASNTGGDVGIIAVELLHISSRIGRVSLSKDEFCKQILTVLEYHGYEKFVLVAHSFGTFVTTQMLQHPGISARIESVIMIDPVAILLHLPDVATNFMIKQPRTANEWQLWYFGSRDAGVAHTFARRFFWSESILWKEDLASRRATIFLGERDLLVDTAHVYEYLLGLKEAGATFDQNGEKLVELGVDGEEKRLNVVMCPDMDHGQIFDTKKWRTRLIREVYSHAAIKQSIS
jgi:pimeloyl-ACP methyl ester carboxylesterase